MNESNLTAWALTTACSCRTSVHPGVKIPVADKEHAPA